MILNTVYNVRQVIFCNLTIPVIPSVKLHNYLQGANHVNILVMLVKRQFQPVPLVKTVFTFSNKVINVFYNAILDTTKLFKKDTDFVRLVLFHVLIAKIKIYVILAHL